MRAREWLGSLGLVVAVAGAAAGDVVHLTNGREIAGRVAEVGPERVVVELPGGRVTLPAERVGGIDWATRSEQAALWERLREERAAGACLAPLGWGRRPEAGALALAPFGDADLERAVAAVGVRRDDAGRRLGPRVRRAARLPVEAAADLVGDCYRAGRRDLADEVVAVHPRVFAAEALPAGASLEPTWANGSVRLAVRGRAAFGPGDAAVAVPPGTFAAAVEPEGPRPQDLGLIEAPVLVLRDGGRAPEPRPRVVCAAKADGSPDGGYTWALHRFPAGSPIDRLMQVLVAEAPPEAVAQAAVWAVRNGATIGWDRDATFGSARITTDDAPAIVAVCARAGVDPRALPAFAGAFSEPGPGTRAGPPSPEPERDDPPAPRAEPAGSPPAADEEPVPAGPGPAAS